MSPVNALTHHAVGQDYQRLKFRDGYVVAKAAIARVGGQGGGGDGAK